MHRFLLIFITLFILAGCGGNKQITESKTPEGEADKTVVAPATFTGELPCPDCESVQMTLNLRADNLYQMRKEFKGKGTVVSQMGLWRLIPEENLIVLGKKKGSLKTYVIQSADTLKFIDYQAEKASEQISYELYRQQDYEAFTDTVKMRGMYKFDGTKGEFTECLSGTIFAVEEEGESSKLERAYLNTPHGVDEPLLTSVRGSLKSNPESLVVDHFTRLYPGRDCSGEMITASLTGTSWKLIEMDGEQVLSVDNKKIPFFSLERKGSQVRGFGGCNRFFGTYLMRGDLFVFNKLASTRMACRQGSAVEEGFFGVLDSTETFRIEEDILILLDKEGVERAKLLATP